MAKPKAIYHCSQCGAQTSKWSGQCGDCGEWNSISEQPIVVVSKQASRFANYSGTASDEVTLLNQVELQQEVRLSTGLEELDRVLGGGLVSGSVVLMGGDPGIGKSTILLQTLCDLSQQTKALYITGEESLQQVALRAQRLNLPLDKLHVLAETNVDKIIGAVR